MSDGGKGSKPRPYSVSQEEYDNRWEAIFGRDKQKENTDNLQKQLSDENERMNLYKETKWKLL